MKGRLLIFISLMLASCRGTDRNIEENSSAYARYFEILDNPVRVVVMSPYDATADTFLIRPSVSVGVRRNQECQGIPCPS